MNNLLKKIVFIFSLLLVIHSSSNGIEFGQTIYGSITTAGQMNTYYFNANSGDVIFMRVVLSSGNLYPGMRIYDPYGMEIEYVSGSPTAEIVSSTLPSSGMFMILVYDESSSNTNTGNYYIYLQRLNNPGNTISFNYGETKYGAVTTPAQMNTYTFSANSGDVVFLRLILTAGNLYPGIRIFDHYGTEIAYVSGSPTAEILPLMLLDSGTFIIQVYDESSSYLETGNYIFYLQRLNNLSNVIPISYGETKYGAITTAVQMGTYTFSANSGDVVFVRVVVISGNLYPGIRIFDPDWSDIAYASGAPTAEISGQTVTQNGAYTIQVYDESSSYTALGNYAIYLQRLNNPAKVFYNDINLNGIVDAGDTLIWQFDQRMRVNGASSSDFYLPVTGDKLGAGATVSINSVNDTQVVVTLGSSPKLTISDVFSLSQKTANSPSGIDISGTMTPNAIEDLAGNDAVDGGVPGVNDYGFDILYAVSSSSLYVPAYSAATVKLSTDTVNYYYANHKTIIPLNSLTTSASIVIGPPGNNRGQLSAVSFRPSSLTFSSTTPAILVIEYKDADAKKELGYIEQAMKIHQWNESSKKWIPLPETLGKQSIDTSSGTVSVKINKFNMIGNNTTIVYANIAIPTVGSKTTMVAPASSGLWEHDLLTAATSVTVSVGTEGNYLKHRILLSDYSAATSGVAVVLLQVTKVEKEQNSWSNYDLLRVTTSSLITTAAILTMEYKDFDDPLNDVINGEEHQLRIYRRFPADTTLVMLPEPQVVNRVANTVTVALDRLSTSQLFGIKVDPTIPAMVYRNSYGAFSVESDLTQWYFETYGDGIGSGILSWTDNYAGRLGVVKLNQIPGEKGKLTQVFSVPSTGWYTAVAKIATDIVAANPQQKVYLYLQELDSNTTIIATANQVVQPGNGGLGLDSDWRELQVSFYMSRTLVGVQVVGINPGSSGISGSLYIDDVWVYAGGPSPAKTLSLTNPSFTSNTAGWLLQVYGDGTGTGTWSWASSWSSHTGVLKGIQIARQKAKESQSFSFTNNENQSFGSVWVYSGATSKSNTQKVYLYLYSTDTVTGKIIESGNAILQPGNWTPGVWQQIRFGYTPFTINNTVQLVAINPNGKPTQTIYFDDVVVKQD